MGGSATLLRAPSTSSSALRPSASSVPALRLGLVLLTFSMAFLAIWGSPNLVGTFHGSLVALHAASNYWNQSATAIAWSLLAAALLCLHTSAGRAGARRRAKTGLKVGIGGAFVMVAAAGISLWASVLATQSTGSGSPLADALGVGATGNEIRLLDKTWWALQAAGWIALAVGALLARPTARGSVVNRAWRSSLTVLGLAFALAAVAPAATLVFVATNRAIGASQLTVLLVYVAPALSWLAGAFAALLAGTALRGNDRSRDLSPAAPVAALGALLVAVWATTGLISQEFLLVNIWYGWHPNLQKVGSATYWVGYLCLTIGFGIAAMRLVDRTAVRLLPPPRGAGMARVPASS